MKKTTFFGLLLLLQIAVSAQTENKEIVPSTSSSNMALETGVAIGFEKLNLTPLALKHLELSRLENESSSFVLGLNQRFVFPIHQKWELSAGLGVAYHYFGFGIKAGLLNTADAIGGIDYNAVTGDETIIITRARHHSVYVYIPVGARFYLKKNTRFRMSTVVELGQWLLPSTRMVYRTVEANSGFDSLFPDELSSAHGLKAPLDAYFIEQIKNYALSTSAGVEVAFKIGKNLWLSQQYTAQYNLITKSNFIEKAYGFGIENKFRYRF